MHARLTEGELKNNGHAADQIIKRTLISVVGGLLHQSYKRRERKKPCLKKPLDAPPSAAGSTHDQLTAKQPVSETVSDVGGGRPEMKPYQPISGFMAHVYMFHAHPAAPLDCNTRQASGLLFFLSFPF